MVSSLRRISALAGNTFTELTRLKVFYFVLLFALLLIGSASFLTRFSFQQEFQVLKDVSLGAISIFSSVLAIAATARLLPQESEDRTVYTILSKPVRRIDYLAGKLLGVAMLLALSVIVMTILFVAVLYLREYNTLAETTRQMAGLPPSQLDDALREIRAAGFQPILLAGVAIIFLKSCLLASLTLFISSFATSSIFTIVVAVFVYFIGHLQATAREFWLQEQGGGWLSRVFLAVVALIFPDLQLFDPVDQVVTGAALTYQILGNIAALSAFYITLYLLLAAVAFEAREL